MSDDLSKFDALAATYGTAGRDNNGLPVRAILSNSSGIHCTRCKRWFNGIMEGEDHVDGPMCGKTEKREQQP